MTAVTVIVVVLCLLALVACVSSTERGSPLWTAVFLLVLIQLILLGPWPHR